MPERVRRVAGKVHTGLLLYWQIVLGWPDVNLVVRYVKGFAVTGIIEPSPVFRSKRLTPVGEPTMANYIARRTLFDSAAAYIDKVESSLKPAVDPAIDVECEKAVK